MRFRPTNKTALSLLLPALLLVASLAGCAGNLASNVAVYTRHKETLVASNEKLHLTLVKPVAPTGPPVLVVFASGDGGLMGVSKALLQHLADGSRYVAGFSSREALNALKDTSGRLNYFETRDTLVAAIAQAKRSLALPEDAETIVMGMSRGANMVIAAAADRGVSANLRGAIAVALTREMDYLALPQGADQLPGIEKDSEGRVKTYPAIERAASVPLAVIQSTNDKYVPAAESRKLLGPDTALRRLYEVKASNHSFGGGEADLMRDLDDAMKWILTANPRAQQPSAHQAP